MGRSDDDKIALGIFCPVIFVAHKQLYRMGSTQTQTLFCATQFKSKDAAALKSITWETKKTAGWQDSYCYTYTNGNDYWLMWNFPCALTGKAQSSKQTRKKNNKNYVDVAQWPSCIVGRVDTTFWRKNGWDKKGGIPGFHHLFAECNATPVGCFSKPGAYITHNAI